MISKAKQKYIRLLEQKKYRRQEQVFVAEGPKVVADLLENNVPTTIVATSEWLIANASQLPMGTEIIEVTAEELTRVSFLKHPQQVMAVFPIPDNENITPSAIAEKAKHDLVLALDGVQDPGNLGTIIRIADWFGITDIVCSPETAEVWNPKVVQATMGSIARIKLTYMPLADLLDAMTADTPIYGTLLDGDSIYEADLKSHGLIIMGNEGNGITDAVAERVTHRLLIPNYPADRPTADSLNVAIATAITCSELRRLRN